jgi:carbamoyltransferase
MRILGINRSQDGSACLLEDGEITIAVLKERLNRQKTSWGALGDIPLYKAYMGLEGKPIDLVVENYASDLERHRSDEYAAELAEHLTFTGGAPKILQPPPHLAHAYSTFHPSPFEEAAVMIVDYKGSVAADVAALEGGPFAAEAPFGKEVPPYAVETDSFYRAGPDGIVPLRKGWGVPFLGRRAQNYGLGAVYRKVSLFLFPGGKAPEGKVMGLAPYGDPKSLGVEIFDLQPEGRVAVHPNWGEELEWDRFRHFHAGSPGKFEDAAQLAALIQSELERALLHMAKWMQVETGSKHLCLAGGVALNCVANRRILLETDFEDIYVIPAPHDGGVSLGLALLGEEHLTGKPNRTRVRHDGFGREYSVEEMRATLEAERGVIVEEPADVADATAERLEAGDIVGWFQGRSEMGPRALGQRSIVCDPRGPHTKDKLNARVKHREAFRPFAPSVLAAHANEYFEDVGESPFMLKVARVLDAVRDEVPAITHVDGTARLQTVDPEICTAYGALISAFHKRTGCPLVLDTSFNVRGEPIVESPRDALDCFLSTNLDALTVGPFLVRKRDPEDAETQAAFPSWKPTLTPGMNLVTRHVVGSGTTHRIEYPVTFRKPRVVGPEAFALVSACDGSRSVGDLFAAHAEAYSKEDMTAFLWDLYRARIIDFR